MKTQSLVVLVLALAAKAFAATAIHHYSFNGSGVVDLIGSADATLLNGATVASGRLNLDGINDYSQFDTHIVPTSGSFTVAFFAQELAPDFTYTEMISQGFSNAPGFYVGYDPAHKFRIGDHWTNTGIFFPTDGLVHHYAVTVGSGTRLYVDGVLVGTSTTIGMTSGGNHTRLGRQFEPFSEFFQGNIDDLWIFSGALTDGEVAALAANSGMCPADLDGSGEVDSGDIGLILLDFGPCPGCPTDLDGSGEVDSGDVGLALLDFGPCP